MNDANNAGINRIWFDTEFIEDGTTIDLISIGLVRSDGATYYAETDQWIPGKASQWVKDNVIVHLRGGDATKPRDVIAREIVEFAGENPEFWAYYADYDWVALCQLYGTMMQLPEGWPMFCRDVKQFCVDIGNPKLPEQTTTEHHALADAQWTKLAWEHCRALSTPNAPVEQREAIARALMEQFHNPDESWFVPEDEYEASKFLVKCADAILAVRLDEAADPRTTLHTVISDIREKTGLGAKPMLSELADAIAAEMDRRVADEREKCLSDLQRSYPDHAWLNAACAAIRDGGKQP